MRKSILNSSITYIVTILFFIFDQWSKYAISNELALGESKTIFLWLYFTHVVNYGAAFSSFNGQKVLLSLFAIVIITGLIIFERISKGYRTKLLSFSIGFILSGAFGNLIDRLRFGRVTDFLDLRATSDFQFMSFIDWKIGQNIWPIFNVADISINIGIGLLILFYIFQDKSDERKQLNEDFEDDEIIENNS